MTTLLRSCLGLLALCLFLGAAPLSAEVAGPALPGSTSYSSSDLQRLDDAFGLISEAETKAAVHDPARQYAYIFSRQGAVTKLDLTQDPPARMGQAPYSLSPVAHAAVDLGKGLIYVLRVSTTTVHTIDVLSLPTDDSLPVHLGSVDLPASDATGYSLAVDESNDRLYMITSTDPAMFVTLSTASTLPVRLSGISLGTGNSAGRLIAVDETARYAYVTLETPSKLVKLDISTDTPSVIGSLTFASNPKAFSLARHPVTGKLYVGFNEPSPSIALVDPNGAGTPALVGFSATAAMHYIRRILIDPAADVAYTTIRGRVERWDLGDGTSPPVSLGSVSASDTNYTQDSAILNTARDRFHTWSNFDYSHMLTFTASTLAVVDRTYMNSGHGRMVRGRVDNDGYIYFLPTPGANTPQIAKFRINDGDTPPELVGYAMAPGAPSYIMRSLEVDPANGYFYAGTDTSPARIMKGRLGAGDSAPSFIGYTTMPSGVEALVTSAIDLARQQALFAVDTFNTTSSVAKVSLGVGDALPTYVGSRSFRYYSAYDYERAPTDAVYDPVTGKALFAMDMSFARMVSMTMENAPFLPSHYNSTLHTNYDYYQSMGLDPRTRSLIVGAGAPTDRRFTHISKLRITSDGSTAVVGQVEIPSRYGVLALAVDTGSGYAYGADYEYTGRLYKVRIGDQAADLPAIVQTYDFPSSQGTFGSATFDPATGRLILATNSNRIATFRLGQQGYLKGTRVTLAEAALVDSVNFYSHRDSGNVRLALYDDAEPKSLLWESGPVANSAAGGWLNVPLTTPMELEAGDYWLAWQQDTNSESPSLLAGGAPGDGFTLDLAGFAASPSSLASAALTSTSDRWAVNMQYTPLTAPVIGSVTATGTAADEQPLAGYTATTTVNLAVALDAGSSPATALSISDDDFATSVTVAYQPNVAFDLTSSVEGPRTIKLVARNLAGDSAPSSATITLLITPPVTTPDTTLSNQVLSIISGTFDITFTPGNPAAFQAIRLFARRQGGKALPGFSAYPTDFTASPMQVDLGLLGGPGVYDFYTVGVDNAGNLELDPVGPTITNLTILDKSAVRDWIDLME